MSFELIRCWLEEAKKVNATHMLVVCDTYAWEDDPVYVFSGQDIYTIMAQNNGPNMTRLMEVYNMSMDLEKQLHEVRAMQP